ncbi:MAG TPA: ATP-binding protein [Kofleriaceae bacterium]
MKLRDRLYLFTTGQLAVFGLLFGLAYASFETQVLPMFRDLLHNKTEQVARMLRGDLDIPLGAEDLPALRKAAVTVLNDEDLAYLVIQDAQGKTVLVAGHPPAELYRGVETHGFDADREIRAWTTISLEGLELGAAAVGFTTARIDALDTWGRRIAVVAIALWLGALWFSLRSARVFIAPVRAMMLFTRKVAGGALDQRLTGNAPGELAELRDHLNHMTAELERREAERRAATAAAEAMQRELLAVSRRAGMAEIATGVLHNVGNVLNSLNISVAVLGDQVRGSRIAGLGKSLALAEACPGGLAGFLATDKGKLLPGYLTQVTRKLADDNARILDELGQVSRHVDHIKTIVAMQQSYARPTGLIEPLAIGALIDDALHLGESSFARHGIEVIRDYPSDLIATTDRHKLLQILINLIANARHALKDRAAPPQQLTVRVRQSPTHLTIAVIDTGVGIPAENLDRIFQHGFTTKPGGHGFGLHASANAAHELGGRLTVESDGPDRGAAFTLELPVARPAIHPEAGHELRN